MSAHCNKCGADISYPEGTWPLGRCEPCDLRAQTSEAKRLLAEALWDEVLWSSEELTERMELVYVALGGDPSGPDADAGDAQP